MKLKDRQAFIKNYFKSVHTSVLSLLDKVPADWSGEHLRVLVMKLVDDSVSGKSKYGFRKVDKDICKTVEETMDLWSK